MKKGLLGLIYFLKTVFWKHRKQLCVCVCFQRFPLTNYQSDGCGSTLPLSYIYNYQSDVHVTYYWDELWGKESTGSESGPHGRLEQVLYFQKCLLLLICFWLSLTLTCNIVSQYSRILCTRIKDSMFCGLKTVSPLFIYLFYIYIVESQFVTQTHKNWVISPMSPIQ